MIKTKDMDYYTFYNHLIYEGILKKRFKNAGDFYLSASFKEFKDSLYGKILHNKLSVNALGLYKSGASEAFIIEVTDEDSNKGLVDLKGNTIIPVCYKKISQIKTAEHGMFFIAEQPNKLFSLFINNELIVKDANDIIPNYSSRFDYELKDENVFVRDIEYSLKKTSTCDEILINKTIPFTDKIKKLIEGIEFKRAEIECVYDESSKYSLYDNTRYHASLALKNNESAETLNTCVVLKTEMFEEDNSLFLERFELENGLIPDFFNNKIFVDIK